ncbi:MAG TPA: discoidin domain-containing protein [Polyangiaceae bacterium]|nr:discoidin domain-containing protein [Polyangiaceae bacterium]
MRLREFRLVALLPLLAACATDVEESAVSSKSDALTLMDKPGTEAASFTEAGRDIAQSGSYTFYGADTDSNTPGGFDGSAHLFKNNTPLRSYAATTIHPGTRFGYFVGLSPNWVAGKIDFFPVSPGVVKDAVLLVGKNAAGEFESCGTLGPNGEIPNCVTCAVGPDDGQGLPDFARLTCAAVPQATVLRPAAFSGEERIIGLALSGDELLLSSSEKIAQMKWNGSAWVEAVIARSGSETFDGPLVQSENRLAATVARPDGTRVVNIYQRASATQPWQFAFRVHPSTPRSDFGTKLALSGNSLLALTSGSVYFIDLVTGTPADIEQGASRTCVLTGSAYDIAVSGNKAVVATNTLPLTFQRGEQWSFHGGLPGGLFPRDVGQGSGSTLATLWGAAIDGDRVAIGWRNYAGDNPTATGAAIGFGFDDYGCGSLRTLPNGTQARVAQLSPVGVTAPAFYQFPVGNAIDGSSGTRWMAPQTPGTTIAFDLGELRMLNHLELEWGTTYGSNVTVQISENGTSWVDVATVSGSGGTQVVDLSQNTQAFGRHVRLRINDIKNQPGTGDWGVAIHEARIYRRVSDSCAAPPQLTCTGSAPAHVCQGHCGGSAPSGCYCDEACSGYGDCCSPDGSDRGAQYASTVAAVCGY